VDNLFNELHKPSSLAKSIRRVREGRQKDEMVELRAAAPEGIMPSRAVLGVPVKEIGDVADVHGPERRTIMEKRLFVGPGRMSRTSRMHLQREDVE
jgi:hypothetical protein